MAKYMLVRLGSELSHRPLVGGVYVDLLFFFFFDLSFLKVIMAFGSKCL